MLPGVGYDRGVDFALGSDIFSNVTVACPVNQPLPSTSSSGSAGRNCDNVVGRGFIGECIMATHGRSGTPEYVAWKRMIGRCYDKNRPVYPRYGGRGILVCDRWRHSFPAFYADMGPKPSSEYTLERINNSLGYSPENCKWATRTEQNRNKRTNVLLTYDGRTCCIAEWSEITGLPYNVIYLRIRNGWSVDDVLTRPQRIRRPIAKSKGPL